MFDPRATGGTPWSALSRFIRSRARLRSSTIRSGDAATVGIETLVEVGAIAGVGVLVAVGNGLLVGVGIGVDVDVASGSRLLTGVGVNVAVGNGLLSGVGADVGREVGVGREAAIMPKTGEPASFLAETASTVR